MVHGVHNTRRDSTSFMWHQPCQRCKYTTSVDIKNSESARERRIGRCKSGQQSLSVCLSAVSVCLFLCLSVCHSLSLSLSPSLRAFLIEADLRTHEEKTHEEKRIMFIQYSTFVSFDTCGWSHPAATIFEISFSDCMGNSTGREIRSKKTGVTRLKNKTKKTTFVLLL